MSDEPATEATKTALENSVTWFLQDKIQDASIPIATKKYLTNTNQLVYLTKCNVAESSVPKIKVQILVRVAGGIHEIGYQLFADHHLTKYENEMIFGKNQGATAAGDKEVDVSEPELQSVIQLVNTLGTARQTL